MRYEAMMDGSVPKPTTKMLRVVDRQGYHLRWIEVPIEEKTAALREGTAAEMDDSKSDGG